MSDDPKVILRDGEGRLKIAAELVSAIESVVPKMTSSPANRGRHFAALGLARGTRLWRAMELLFTAPMHDVSSLPLRPIFETMLLSLYALYGGDGAYREIQAAFVHQQRLLPDATQSHSPDVDGWTGPTAPINWKGMAAKVGNLLSTIPGEEQAVTLLQGWYELLYRGESFTSVHAGAGTLMRYRTSGPMFDGIRLDGYQPHQEALSTNSLIVGASFLGILASHVLEIFGYSRSRVRGLWQALVTGTSVEDVEIASE